MTGRPYGVLRLLAALLLASACGQSGGPPRLELSQAEYAARDSSTQPVVGARFQVRNAGEGRLHLRAVVGDCACHVAIVGSEVLGSREHSTIAARCRVVPGTGGLRRLRLHSNDPAHGTSLLTIRVPEGGAVARPAAVSFGHVEVGREATREIVVPDASSSVRLSTGTDAFALEPGAVGRDGSRTYRVRFTPQEPGVARTILERGSSAVQIAVSGVGFADLAVYPAEVRTPSAVAEDLPPLFLKNLSDAPVEITRIDFPPDITGELQTIVAGEEFRVRLRSVRHEVGAGSPGAIRVHTTARGAPSVVVPVIRAAAVGSHGA